MLKSGEVFFKVIVCYHFFFVGFLVPFSSILRKVKFHYEFGDKETRINHLPLMDELKLFGKSNDQIDSLVNTQVY